MTHRPTLQDRCLISVQFWYAINACEIIAVPSYKTGVMWRRKAIQDAEKIARAKYDDLIFKNATWPLYRV